MSFVIHSFAVQLSAFVLLSVSWLLLTRPLVKRWRGTREQKYTLNVQQLVGEHGVMVSKLSERKTGMVRVGNEMWSAHGEFSEAVLEKGDHIVVVVVVVVVVVAVKSSLLIVRKMTREDQP